MRISIILRSVVFFLRLKVPIWSIWHAKVTAKLMKAITALIVKRMVVGANLIIIIQSSMGWEAVSRPKTIRSLLRISFKEVLTKLKKKRRTAQYLIQCHLLISTCRKMSFKYWNGNSDSTAILFIHVKTSLWVLTKKEGALIPKSNNNNFHCSKMLNSNNSRNKLTITSKSGLTSMKISMSTTLNKLQNHQ